MGSLQTNLLIVKRCVLAGLKTCLFQRCWSSKSSAGRLTRALGPWKQLRAPSKRLNMSFRSNFGDRNDVSPYFDRPRHVWNVQNFGYFVGSPVFAKYLQLYMVKWSTNYQNRQTLPDYPQLYLVKWSTNYHQALQQIFWQTLPHSTEAGGCKGDSHIPTKASLCSQNRAERTTRR